MDVPLFSPNVQNEFLAEGLLESFRGVLSSGQFILGREVEVFEKEIADWHGVGYAVGMSSGTDALLVALMAEGIGPGDEVIVPSFTFFGTAGVVARLGATPVFVDVCPACYLVQPRHVAGALTERTRAVIPVHLFGQACDVEGIRDVLGNRRVVILEDAAQAMGAKRKGMRVGRQGEWTALSFFPTKNLGGFGDGGMLLTGDAGRADTARRLRNHGMHPKYVHEQVGGNFRLDALQASLLRRKLPEVQNYILQRRENARRYLSELEKHPSISLASKGSCPCGPECAQGAETKIILPQLQDGQTPAWNQFTIRVTGGKRDDLKEYLSQRGIGSEIYYPMALHEQPCFRASHQGGSLPVTETLCREVLSLPVYPELAPEQIDYVIDAITGWVEAEAKAEA